MNVINRVFLLFSLVVLSAIVSCSKDQTIDNPQELKQDINLEIAEEKAAFLSSMVISQQRSPITYAGELCGDLITATHANTNSISNRAEWDYYWFDGNAGDLVDIYVRRTTPYMDPSFRIISGIVTDTSDFYPIINGGDDQEPDPFNSCFDDPRAILNLPSTGTFTLAIFDFASCGTDLGYEIITTGISCVTDADGDGCDDATDPHPNSIMEATVIIDGCDSGIPNQFITDCSTMSDLIADCAATAIDHGDFVNCVAHLTNEWKSAGFIVGNEKGDILSCAGQSNLP